MYSVVAVNKRKRTVKNAEIHTNGEHLSNKIIFYEEHTKSLERKKVNAISKSKQNQSKYKGRQTKCKRQWSLLQCE